MRLAQLLGENEDANRELTDIEKKALEFEISAGNSSWNLMKKLMMSGSQLHRNN